MRRKKPVRLRVLGQDRPGVAFKVTAQQWQPVLSGNPQLVTMGLFSAITPGDSCHVNMQCTLDNASQGLGYATISKVWWDAFGTAGTWSDSTATLSYTWNTTVPTGASGQRRAMIAKARDANGLWSAPCTLTVQFVELTKSVTMLSIPAGTFQMGDTNAILLNQGSLSSPLHSVTLGAFTMSQTLVTQEQYLEVMDTNPSFSKSGKTYPVESVTWYDAALFCNALSKMAGTDTVYNYAGDGIMDASVVIDYSKNGFRLPTEAEYEYAYRAGTTTDYYWGRNYPPITTADTLAMDSNAVWYYDSPDGTHPVATKKQNLWGLYDMAGNLWEWCNDWYGSYRSVSG
jgi:formylglycine-generating enzyme required for sulfatase activity